METIKANILFADDRRREFKDQALETCWETIEKVDFGKVLGGALGKAPGIDGQKASTGRLTEHITEEINKDRAQLVFQANYQRDSCRHDKAVVLLKPGEQMRTRQTSGE